MTESEAQEWRERLRAAVAETLRKRQAMRDLRQQHATRRAHGLQQRHAAKLARNRPQNKE